MDLLKLRPKSPFVWKLAMKMAARYDLTYVARIDLYGVINGLLEQSFAKKDIRVMIDRILGERNQGNLGRPRRRR